MRRRRAHRAAGLGVLLGLWALAATPAAAHNVGDSYLYLQIRSDAVSGRFEVALEDLNPALGLAGTPREITAENFEQNVPFLRSYYERKVAIYDGDRRLPLLWTESDVLAGHHGYGRLAFDLGDLEAAPPVLTVDYGVLFDEDPDHRGYLLVESNWATGTFANEGIISLVFAPDDRRQDFEIQSSGRLRGFLAVLNLGMEHIWEGVDHILFLIALLLPAVLRREDGSWRPVDSFRPAFFQVVKIVTAFTVAHSITLSLAALGLVNLPERLVEVVIAASVALAAADLLVPIFRDKLWLVILGFGLFHGFGFAGALAEMGVLGEHAGLALLAFNLGVEVGQIAIVACLVPLLFLIRRPVAYRKALVPAAAVFMILVAGVWMAERTFDVDVPMYESLPPALQRIVP